MTLFSPSNLSDFFYLNVFLVRLFALNFECNLSQFERFESFPGTFRKTATIHWNIPLDRG